jgi:glycosyltransferase involved in cell wall biosynthesis
VKPKKLRVAHHQRLPFPGQVSIERVFETVRAHLPDDITVDVHVASTPSKRLWPRLRSVFAARRVRADVHHHTGDTTYQVLLLPKRRTIITLHDCEFLDRKGPLRGFLYRLFWLQLPVLRASVVTAVSPATADDVRRWLWIQPRDLRVIPNPLPDGIAADSADVAPADTGQRPVLLVGTTPNKRVGLSVQALAGLDVPARVVGQLTPEQREAFERSGVQVVDGQLEGADLPAAYAGAALLLFPSWREGFGLPVIEAQALGCPVVISNRAPLPWVAGEGGAVVPDGDDAAAIHRAVRRVLDDESLRTSLGAEGQVNVRRFEADAVAASYAALYEEVADRARRDGEDVAANRA